MRFNLFLMPKIIFGWGVWIMCVISYFIISSYRFHEVRALRALMHAARALRENGDDMEWLIHNEAVICIVVF